MPKISVIVPVYNVEAYLKRCVDSVLKQSYTDFELILVDDGSPDESPAICDEYAAKDDRVRVIHKKNGGLSDARNKGIEYTLSGSDSEWITFIDSDDWVHSDFLQVLLDAATETGLAVSIGRFYRTTGQNMEVDRQACRPVIWDVEEYFLQENTNAIIACAKLYRKDCFETIRYPVDKLHEDEYTTYKILFQQSNVAVVTQPLYGYYINPNSITEKRDHTRYMDRVLAFEERIDFLENTPFTRAYALSVEMYMCRLYGALNSIYVGGIKAPEDVRAIRGKIRQTRRTLVKQLDKPTQKRIQKDRWRYLVHFPNRLMIRLLGAKRYERWKGTLRRA